MSEEATQAAARAALVALRGCLARSSDALAGYCILLPNLTPLSNEAAAEALATMPKPLSCAAFATMQVLAVAVWTSPEDRVAYMSGRREELAHVRSHYGGPDTRLLVRGSGEEVLLSPSALEEWYLGYDLMLANSVTDKPSASERARGADAVTVFKPLGVGGIYGRGK